MANDTSRFITIAHGVVETLAIVIGFPLTMIALMSVSGIFWKASGFARASR